MKKEYILIFIILLGLFSCEEDDFCTENTTPQLIIRFFDKSEPNSLKKVEKLTVLAKGLTDTIIIKKTTDSITLPLQPIASKTEFILKTFDTIPPSEKSELATLTINYSTSEQYVSRSCGYKVIFDNLTIKKSNWIDSLSTTSIKNINDQNNAHLKIYH